MKILFTLIYLSSFLLHPVTPLCAPRYSPYDRLLRDFHPPPSPPSISLSKHLPRPFLASFADHVSSIAKSDASVKAICDKTDHPDDCLSSIQSVAPDTHHADAPTVLRFAIKAIRAHTQAATEHAIKLASDPKNTEMINSIFGVCTEGYEDAMSDLESAEKRLDVNDKGALNSELSALVSDYGGCSDAFNDAEMESPMKFYEELLNKLVGNCLAIARLV